jgi:hypothetical protein
MQHLGRITEVRIIILFPVFSTTEKNFCLKTLQIMLKQKRTNKHITHDKKQLNKQIKGE